jgi:hypothetical protein
MAYPIAQPISLRRQNPIVQSLLVWLVLLGFVGVTNLFITYVGAGLENDPRSALFSWPAIALFGILGSIGIVLAHRTGFPRAWDESVSVSRRLGVPALLGIAIGLLESALDMVTHWSTVMSYGAGGAFHAPWPGSPLFYTSGAVEVEVLYRLLTVPLLLWLISNLALRGRFQNQIFWILAVLSSLLEPMDQDLRELGNGAPPSAVAAAFVPDLLLNLAQVVMFRRYGFVAAIATRVVFYMVWHVAYGNFVCGC